jgi:prepilin-type N-terminal cleavage/methylation domain-containing protein
MRSKRGFTLVELLIVVIIISVLATIAIPKFADSNLRAKESRVKLFLYTLRNATERFHNDVGLWPTSGDLLNGTVPTQGYDDAGTLKSVQAGLYNGPYFDKENFRVGIAGVSYAYGIGAPYQVGSWRLTGVAVASDGTLYSSW